MPVERALPHVKVQESYGLTEGGSPLRAPIDGRPVPRGSPGAPAPGHRAQARSMRTATRPRTRAS